MTVPEYHPDHDLAVRLAAGASYGQSAKSGFHATDNFSQALQQALQPLIDATESDVEHRMIKIVVEELTTQLSGVWQELQHTKRLLLLVGEVIEAFEELRHGHSMAETYYVLTRDYSGFQSASAGVDLAPHRKGDKVIVQYKEDVEDVDPAGAVGLFKPEGVPMELADVQIRLWDLVATAGVDLGRSTREKHAFNATREFMHGRQF